jgi:hypothetical protein
MTIKAKCYCGATQFEVEAIPASVTACTCSFCSKTGALWAYYTPDQVKFTRLDSEGVFAPQLNRHHFCSVCGIPTFGESPTWDLATRTPNMDKLQLGLNARLFEDVDLAAVELRTIDGRNLW